MPDMFSRSISLTTFPLPKTGQALPKTCSITGKSTALQLCRPASRSRWSRAAIVPELIGSTRSRPNLRPGANPNPVLGGPDRYFDATRSISTYRFCRQPWKKLDHRSACKHRLLARQVASLRRRAQSQFRTEVFNIFNRANFGILCACCSIRKEIGLAARADQKHRDASSADTVWAEAHVLIDATTGREASCSGTRGSRSRVPALLERLPDATPLLELRRPVGAFTRAGLTPHPQVRAATDRNRPKR